MTFQQLYQNYINSIKRRYPDNEDLKHHDVVSNTKIFTVTDVFPNCKGLLEMFGTSTWDTNIKAYPRNVQQLIYRLSYYDMVAFMNEL